MRVKKEASQRIPHSLNAASYVHLHNHTHHSVLDGLTKIPALINRVKDLGMDAVAITDHGTMSGAVEFYKAAKAAGIKPIIGMEAYIAARSRHDRDPQKDKARYHLIILAMNKVGYQNLMRLSSAANLEGMYYKPRIDHELLKKYNEGLIILSGCASGELGENLRNDNYDEAKRIAAWYKSIFGDRYYLELQDHGHPDAPAQWDIQVKINNYLERIATELAIQLVVTSDGHYLVHADQDAHEILLAVGTGAFLADEKRMSLKDFELHVTEPLELIDRWSKTNPQAVLNTKIIADRCNVELELGGILIPTFPTPKGYNEKTYLLQLVFQGLVSRYGDGKLDISGDPLSITIAEYRKHLPNKVLERADYELGVIDRMGYSGYFLIVQDFINWGKNRGIIFGPGRGSAAGSIVSYAVRMTELDPLKYDLLFERFLNPDRISMPDVDIDIQDTRRDEVIQYCTEKYGSERVANIVTFGKMAARAAVRDVARVLQVPYAESDRLAKLIPPPVQGRHIPLSVSVVENVDLRYEYESNPAIKKVLDYAIQLEGTIRSHGVHAAGVVIAPDDIVNFAPVEMSQKGVVATQYPMGPVEELGLLKMDFLGLSNLTTINNALRIIKKVFNITINLQEIPLDDEATYTLLQKGDTTGVFQLESAGMKRYLRELKPTIFDDIIAMVALYRPGPMQFIDDFIKRKHGERAITYAHAKMESALSTTYGVLVYQEQVMQISKDLSGFTGGEADTLRKAIGKKNLEMMAKMKARFIEGAAAQSGAGKHDMEKFWKQLEDFAAYCFNKSHAACYGLIAYWTAYLKAHYPEAFMAALMTSDQGDLDRLAIEMNECKHMGIRVLSPDVNESFVEFAVVPGKKEIRFGMAAIKGVGTAVVEEILRARADGIFQSVEDFARRVSSARVNKKAWESLIKTGAFDTLADRSDLLYNLETIQAFASKLQKEALSGQTDLFGGLGDSTILAQPSIAMLDAPVKHTDKERLGWERELLGLYISAHPLDNYDDYFTEQTVPMSELSNDIDGQALTVGGLISSVRSIVTKSGSKMAFVKIEDKTSETEVIVFPGIYEIVGGQLLQDQVIRVFGKVNARDRDGNLGNDIKIIADDIQIIDDAELRHYESHGNKMTKPKAHTTSMVAKRRIAVSKRKDIKNITADTSYSVVDTKSIKKLFVHVKNPDDKQVLMQVKQICSDYPGLIEVVLVLGADKQSAIKMPFKVDCSDTMIGDLVKIFGEDAVVIK
ncbi:MAG: DNA polymerase III subunit alpha [Candidatus Microsaccharimonas sossegonensis]|uniref:DNA polymerase III subunit alpha n=1 Tax=Candidatus Microsaccharimonas sossegonensis TaxID=2506948 RepID=A0A4V1J7I9_9BACT|nr:MAG: DNA polymerase III subunit alpha [Candidatus Microsaccharimonas sossegonensis]